MIDIIHAVQPLSKSGSGEDLALLNPGTVHRTAIHLPVANENCRNTFEQTGGRR